MSDGHCFISYSNVDGLDFATKLANDLEGGYPFIKVWFEKQEMIADKDDWDDQLAKAIQQCKCLLYVMSQDSTAEHTNCKDEWTWALKYKKPVICLWIDNKAEDQFRLNSRQKIDFTQNFDAGLARLRKSIAHLDSPEGQLEELHHRLADANRDLRRATDESRSRIQADIDELKKQIEVQQKIVDNPKAAEEQTQQNIKSGLAREQQPENPVSAKTFTKFINPPPLIAPTYFQDRFIETKQIVDFLNDDSQRLMTIVGRAGVGKTAMICRLLKGIENGKLPDDLGEMKVDGIVYLSETGNHHVNFANVFADLNKLLSKETAEALDKLYKEPQVSTGDKMRKLLDAFEQGHVILLLDNFENLIDSESLHVKDSELSDALNALLLAPHHAVKVIITTRIAPRDLALVEAGRQHHLSLDDGLGSPFAEKVLREMDADGHIGLKTASEALLSKAREKTRGYPRALEALYAILAVDRYTTLEEILESKLPDEVVHALVGQAFSRLDPTDQKVMQALAVYKGYVTPAAIDYLLQPQLPSIDSVPILNRLVSMHFARRDAGKYHLHTADKEYAFGLLPKGDEITADNSELANLYRQMRMQPPRKERTDFTQIGLTDRAASYFAQARKPRAEWKKLDDLAAQLAEFELRCEAGDFDTAASVLTDFDGEYLHLWGHYRLMIQLHESIVGKITDALLRMNDLNMLGAANNSIGQVNESIKYWEQGISAAQDTKNRQAECVFLGNLGVAHADLGDVHKAIEFYEKQLAIVREISDQYSEGNALGNLGSAYGTLGDARKSIEFYEKQLVIIREISDRHAETFTLGNLGVAYANLGDTRKAIEFYEQALVIAREIGDRRGEGVLLGNIAEQRINLGEYKLAIQSAEQYVKICEGINKPAGYAFGRLAEAYLHNSKLTQANEAIEAALQYDDPLNNHNVSALHGIIALRQRDGVTARQSFTRAISQADEILSKTPDFFTALDAKGLVLCGLALIGRGDPSGPSSASIGGNVLPDKTPDRAGRVAPTVAEAIETFKKARKIAPHAGVVKSVLRLFDELAKCDPDGVLKNVRAAAEGKE